MKNTLLLSIMLFVSASSYAQDKLAQDTIKNIELTKIEIVGIRGDGNTPISQKTITNADIAKTYHGQEMPFILDRTPSITSQSDGGHLNGYATFRMRGIDQTRINMSLNGVPLNEPEDQGVYFSNYPNFALNVKSLQIQRGVGTSANGTASYGGSLNFEGKTGLDKETGVQVSYGSFNTQRANLIFGSGVDKKGFAVYTGLSAYKTDGYKYNSGGSGYSAFMSGGYYGTKHMIKFTGFTGRSLNQMAWLAVSDSAINVDPRTNFNPKGENDDFTQSFAQLQYVYAICNDATITTTAYYNRLKGKWGLFVSPVDLLTFTLGSNFYGAMSNFHYETNEMSVNLGVHANTYNRMHMGAIDTLFLYKNTGYKTDYSTYGKMSHNLGKFVLFTDIQLRHVEFSYVGDVNMTPLVWNFVNPKGGVTYNHTNKVNYYFSVGQNHREPTRTDMFGGQDNLVSLNIIIPEQVVDYELGSNLKFNDLKLQYNLYYMDFKNEITLLGALGSNGLPLMTNVSKSFRSGVEFDMIYVLNKNFSITNSSNYNYSRIKGDGAEYTPLYTPKFINNFGVEYTNKGFFVSVLAKYQAKSYINSDNTMSIPNYVLLNANMGYTYKHYSIDIQLINLTNTRYYSSGYAYDNTRFLYINAPFSTYVTLKASI